MCLSNGKQEISTTTFPAFFGQSSETENQARHPEKHSTCQMWSKSTYQGDLRKHPLFYCTFKATAFCVFLIASNARLRPMRAQNVCFQHRPYVFGISRRRLLLIAAQVYYPVFTLQSALYSLQLSSVIKTRLPIPITKIRQLKHHHSCTLVVYSMCKAIKNLLPYPSSS